MSDSLRSECETRLRIETWNPANVFKVPNVPTPGGPRAGCPILSRNTLCSGVFGLALPALSHTANLGSGPWGAIPPRAPGPPISYGSLDSPRGASVNSCSCEEERLNSSPGRSVVVCRIPSFNLRGVQETHLVCVLITTRGLITCGWVIKGQPDNRP